MKIKWVFSLVLVIFCICSDRAYAQGEGNIWYFGNKAGLDFNGGAPVPLTNGALETTEGCATVSTSAGVLRFYTDGTTVWNNQHSPMPNGTGLLGQFSSTQSAIIVPKPGSTSIYYIFTADAVGGVNGLRYSEVDMSLAGGLGDVTATKNVQLAPKVTEKITAVAKSNGIWVISHEYTTNTFLAYSVTSAGVNTTPVTSSAGTVNTSAGYGHLKPSPDGKKLVQANWGMGIVDVLNFNPATGIVTSDFSFSPPFSTLYTYGVEFSPDGTRLYVDAEVDLRIFQYDMTLGTSAAIIASGTLIGTSTAAEIGAIQTGPDGKIYVARFNGGAIGCINNPNALGGACGYVDNAVSLSGKICQLGLPDYFIPSSFTSPSIAHVDTCFGDSTYFSLSDTSAIDSVLWNFNDPSSGISNTSKLLYPWHIFTSIGTYTVSAIIYAGSVIDTLINITVIKGPPVFTLGNDTSLCNGASIVLDAGVGYTAYLWQDATTTQTKTVLAAGTYYVKVTNSCGSTSDTIHITALTTVSVNSPTICAGDTANLVASGATSYTWSAGATSTGVNTANAVPLSTTTYTVTGTSGSCITTAVSTVTVNPKPAVTVNSPTICIGDTANLIASGATSYTWTSGATSTGTNTAIAVPVNPTTYTVTGTTSGCTDTAHSNVTVVPALSVNVNNAAVCSGSPATLTATGASTYSWANSTGLSSTTGASVTANPLSTTTYTVTGTSNGCSDTATSVVTIATTPVVSVNSGNLCNGDSILLTASGAGLYSWSPSSGLSSTNGASVYAFPSDTTIYSVIGTTAGCSDTAQANVLVYSLPNVSSGSNSPVCAGDALNLTVSAGANYSWIGPGGFSSNIQNPSVSNATLASAGLYSVTVTDINGCEATATVNVTVNPLPVANAVGDTVCLTQTITIGVSGGTSYSWAGPNSYSSSAQNPQLTNASLVMSGSYVVTVTGANNCVTNDTAVVLVTPGLLINASGNSPVCAGDTLRLFADAGVSWNWDGPSGFNSTLQNPVVGLASPAMAGTYTLTAIGSSGCTGTDSVTAVVNPLPIPVAGSNSPVCVGDTLNLTVSVSSSYLWSGPGGFASSVQNPQVDSIVPALAGLYSVNVTDTNGCQEIATINVMAAPLPQIVVNSPAICVGDTAILAASGASTFVWSPATGLSSTLGAVISAFPAATSPYTVTGTDTNNCSSSAGLTVTVNASPVVSVSGATICAGGVAPLIANGAAAYTWSPVSGLNVAIGDTVLATPSTTSVYTVLGIDMNNCKDTASAIVLVNPLPSAVISPLNASGCVPYCLTYLNSAGADITGCFWDFGNNQTSALFAPFNCYDQDGFYSTSLTVTDTNGCTNTAYSIVSVYPLPEADFTYDPEVASMLNPEIQFTDLTLNDTILSWLWIAGDSTDTLRNPQFAFPAAGSYPVTLVVTTTHGCTDTITKNIFVEEEYAINIPNAFTPNNDGINDIFIPKGIGISSEGYKFTIFDRWGNMVFHSNSFDKGWDGSYQAQGNTIVQRDVYVWKIELKTFRGNKKSLKGIVTLVR
ncbi:MAG: gliding motility-associated C-terminal domain-containing protein [Bacteroidia bacterium]